MYLAEHQDRGMPRDLHILLAELLMEQEHRAEKLMGLEEVYQVTLGVCCISHGMGLEVGCLPHSCKLLQDMVLHEDMAA